MISKVVINAGENGVERVTIDGLDITDKVQCIAIFAPANETPHLMISAYFSNIEIFGDAKVTKTAYYMDDAEIQHVAYDQEQCGYEK